MKNYYTLILAFALVAIVSCKKDTKETKVEETIEVEKTQTIQEPNKITFTLESKSNSKATGNIVFVENDGVVTMTALLSGLDEGVHAIHIHEKADCSSPDGKSTGGHWNPTGQPHGKWGSSTGYHKGDIGNFKANAEGNGVITFKTDEWCIGCGDPAKDIVGKAIIVHQGSDDYETQPTGAAGGRVSCGGIIK